MYKDTDWELINLIDKKHCNEIEVDFLKAGSARFARFRISQSTCGKSKIGVKR